MTTETAEPECDQVSQVKLSEDERRKFLDEVIDRNDRIVESEIEMARLFVASGKTDVARRRLEVTIEKYPAASAVEEVRRMVEELGAKG